MSKVFVSYKAEDRKRLAPLIAALEAEGIDVWWDQRISGGSNWREEIERHLEEARCVIVAWSDRTVGPQGRFVRDEAGMAQEAGHYLPITIDDVRPPIGFRETQVIAFKGWKGDRSDPRFRALVAAVHAMLDGSPAPISGVPLPAMPPSGISRRVALAGTGVAALAVAGGTGWYFLGSSARAATKVAVLPFKNLSSDAAEDYFSDGLSEELRGALARAGLQVIGRNSSEAVADEDIPTIVDKLGVSHVLTGSVRKSAEQIRVSAQLVQGKDGVETWAENYDRPPGEAIALQTDIAAQVASALKLTLGTALEKAIELGGTQDAAAQDLYYRALAARQKDGPARKSLADGMTMLQEALRRDPQYARAWIALGRNRLSWAGLFATSVDDMANTVATATGYIRRGAEIAPTLGYGAASLADIDGTNLRMRDCLDKLRLALKIGANDMQVLIVASNFLASIGTRAEADQLVAQMINLDPLNPTAYYYMSNCMLFFGRIDEAVKAGRKALIMAPDNINCAFKLALALAASGKLSEALSVLKPFPELNYESFALRAMREFRAGNLAGVAREIDGLQSEYGDLASYQFAQIYAQTNRIDEAFAALETGFKIKDPGLIDTMRDPLLIPLRNDRRMTSLLNRLDFPIIDPGIGAG